MAFPDTSLDLVVEAYMGGQWRDLSSRLIGGQPATITRGRPNGATQTAAGSCRLTLDDTDGSLTPLNPLGQWYPYVRRGVEYRVGVRRARDAFGRTVSNGWGSPDSGGPWSTAFGAASKYSVSSGAGKHTFSSTNDLCTTILPNLLTDCDQVVSVSTSVAPTGASLVTGTLARYQNSNNYYWLRCEFDHDSTDVVLKISKTVAGGQTTLAVLDPVPGLAYSANTPLRIRTSVAGTRLAIKVWAASGVEPQGWMLAVSDDALTAAGKSGCQSWLVSGNTNTLPVTASYDDYELLVMRLAGNAASYQPRLVPRTDRTLVNAAQIELGGILRRLGQGSSPDLSPMRRTILASGPVAYLPLEDGTAADQGGSAVADAPAAVITGSVAFEPIGGTVLQNLRSYVRPGMTALADITSGGMISAALPASATAATSIMWTLHTVMLWDADNISGDLVILEWTTPGGTYARWQLVGTKTTAHTKVIAYDSAGAAATLIDDAGTSEGGAVFGVVGWQSGSLIGIELWRNGIMTASVGATATLAGIASIATNTTRVTSSTQMGTGQWAVWATAVLPDAADSGGTRTDGYGATISGSLNSWALETATDRLLRTTAEDDIALDLVRPPAADVVRLGSQPVGQPVDIYHDCETAEGGILYESAESISLRYLPLAKRYNRTPSLVIDLSTYRTTSGTSGQVLQPTYDDQQLRNVVTVSRRDGSEATAIDQDSIDADGRYEDSIEVNLTEDTTLANIAGWAVHVGTIDETRTPALAIDLAANPGLIDQWLCTDIGDRAQRTNTPVPMAGTIDQILDGYTETLSHRRWDVSANCSPASPWTVATVDGEQRVAADGSTLAALLPATGPTRINDTMARTISSSWGTADTGGSWTTVGGSASDYSVSPGSGKHSNAAVNTPHRTVIGSGFTSGHILATVKLGALAAGGSVTAAVIARYIDTSNKYFAELAFNANQTMDIQIVRRLPAGFTVLSTATGVATHSTSATYRVRFQLDGSTLRARVWNSSSTEPTTWQVTATDTNLTSGQVGCRSARSTGNTNSPATVEFLAFEVQDGLSYSIASTTANGVWTTDPTDFNADVRVGGERITTSAITGSTSPQTATISARAVNGVTREWPAGAPVDVWAPAVVAL